MAKVANAASVLRAFTTGASRLSVRQLGERTGIARSTVHELCAQLCEVGFLRATGDGYELGEALLPLAGSVMDRSGLARAVEGRLDGLPTDRGQEIHVGQLVCGLVVYVHRVSGDQRVPMFNRVGLSVPAHLSNCGRVALAQLSPDEAVARVRASCDQQRRPYPDEGELRARLAEVARRGWCAGDSVQEGRQSVAAPVFGPDGVVGGLSVAGPAALYGRSDAARLAKVVTAAADRISAALGSNLASG